MLQNRQHTGEYDRLIGRKDLGILGKANQREARETEKEESRTEKHQGKFLQEGDCRMLQRFPLKHEGFLPKFPGNTFSRNSYWCSDDQMTKREEERRVRIQLE